MGKRIEDEFSNLPRQLAYQARHRRDGLCTKCARKAKRNHLCQKHLRADKKDYENRRERDGIIRRYRPRKKKPFGKALPVAV